MAISEIYAAPTDLASTKWVCTTNNPSPSASQAHSPSTNQIIQKTKETLGKDKQNAYATSSLSTAFSSAVLECKDCTEINCKMQIN